MIATAKGFEPQHGAHRGACQRHRRNEDTSERRRKRRKRVREGNYQRRIDAHQTGGVTIVGRRDDRLAENRIVD